jgi:hypothetical protein
MSLRAPEVSRFAGNVSVACAPDGGGWVLRVELQADFDSPRPPGWTAACETLKQRGFDFEPGDDGGPERFLPTSFFSACVGLCATRHYAPERAADLLADLREFARSRTHVPAECGLDSAGPGWQSRRHGANAEPEMQSHG